MIKTLIFDFGDVFINLDKTGALQNALDLFKINDFPDDLISTNMRYEMGQIQTSSFIDFYMNRFPNCTREDIITAWNFILKDFPVYRLEFIEKLKIEKQFQLILLSNTNDMHIEFIKKNFDFFEEFKSCFHQFYLSHEIGKRKPNDDIYQFVLKENNLQANECLFIDDTEENTITAERLGINTWNIDEKQQDVVELFEINSGLF